MHFRVGLRLRPASSSFQRREISGFRRVSSTSLFFCFPTIPRPIRGLGCGTWPWQRVKGNRFVFPFVLLIDGVDQFRAFLVDSVRGRTFPVGTTLCNGSPVGAIGVAFEVIHVVVLTGKKAVVFNCNVFVFSVFVKKCYRVFVQLVFGLAGRPVERMEPRSRLGPGQF